MGEPERKAKAREQAWQRFTNQNPAADVPFGTQLPIETFALLAIAYELYELRRAIAERPV